MRESIYWRTARSIGKPILMLLPMVILLGVVMGANVGYTAETAANASVNQSASALLADTQANSSVDAYPLLPDQYQPQPTQQSGLAQDIGDAVALPMLILALGIADVTAGVIFHNQWIPPTVVNGVVVVLLLGQTGVLLRRAIRGIKQRGS